MVEPVVSEMEPVTLVGGADLASDDLNISLKWAPVLVAADGGADAALAAGLTPRAVIGDLDSISDAARAVFGQVLHRVSEQDSTDFEKAITRIAAPLIIAVGFTGARLDHTLSVFNTLARHPGQPVILLGEPDLAFLVPGRCDLDLPAGTRVSLMPLGRAQVSTQGLTWNAQDQPFDPAGHTSPSNRATGDGPVRVQAEGPVLAILPRAHLDVATTAVRAG